MKLPKVIAIAMVLAMALLVTSVSAGGNGIDLNGPHYNLNLIGMKYPKNVNLDDLNASNGHVIFVKMGNGEKLQTRIYLSEGEFKVIDYDGTDGIARFQLPRPYPEGADVNITDEELECLSAYQVYVRVLGKPGGTGNITTGVCNSTTDTNGQPICIEEAGNVWLSTESVPLSSHGNDGKFIQVTSELTTVKIGDYRYGLFSDTIYGDLYFWDLYNDGMKLIQLRFYPTPEEYCSS